MHVARVWLAGVLLGMPSRVVVEPDVKAEPSVLDEVAHDRARAPLAGMLNLVADRGHRENARPLGQRIVALVFVSPKDDALGHHGQVVSASRDRLVNLR